MRLCCRASDGPSPREPERATWFATELWNIQAWNLLKLFTYLHQPESTGGKRCKHQGMQNSGWAKLPESYKRQQKKRTLSRRNELRKPRRGKAI